MLCERCGKREATVNVVCVVNNTRVSKWLCETCAKEFATEGVLSGQNGEGARNILEEIFKPLRYAICGIAYTENLREEER